MKYLIVQDFAGQPVCFLFPRRVDHVEMRDQLPYGDVISAGFADVKDGKLRCYGGCPELNLRARPEDVEIIEESLRPRPLPKPVDEEQSR